MNKYLSFMIILCVILGVQAKAADEEGCYRCHGLRGFSLRQGDSVNDLTISAGHFDSFERGSRGTAV